MQNKKALGMLTITGILLVIISGLWLATARPVNAQCGSQASSCKDCHEVQGQKSVNADGTGWHQSHAFGDFCYICHGGNTQSTDKAAAHTGMVDPMTDVKASCQQCHPKDLDERAKVYFDKLGTAPGGAAPTVVPAAGCPSPEPTMMLEPASNIPDDKSLVIAKPAYTVDYVVRYNENVLGVRTVDWGMIGLVTLVVAVIVIGAVAFALKMGWVTVAFEKAEKASVTEISTKEEPKA